MISIVNGNGEEFVHYTYDAWGKILSVEGSATNLRFYNPLRYRGYVYDEETGLYYLQSRYYNPEMGRFINGDDQLAEIGGDPLGYNIFAYCMSSPVNMSDSSGHGPRCVIEVVKAVTEVIVAATNHVTNVRNKKQINTEVKEIYDIDTATQEINTILDKYGDEVNATFTDKGVQIQNSIEVTSRYDRQKISTIISRTEGLTDRTRGNLSAEWVFHNWAYNLHIEQGSAISAFLDYSDDSRWFITGVTKWMEIYGWE